MGEQFSRLVLQVPVSHPNPGLDSSHSYLSGPADQFHPDRHGTRTLNIPPPRREGCLVRWDRPQAKLGQNYFSPQGVELHLHSQHCQWRGKLRFGQPASLPGDIMGPFRFVPFFGVPSPGLQHAASGHRPTLCQWKDLSLRSRSGVYRGGPRPLFSSPLPLDPVSISGRFPNTLSRRYPSGPDFFPGVIAVLSIFSKVIILATYCGTRILSVKSGKISVKQNDLLLTAELLSDQGRPLHAPKEVKCAEPSVKTYPAVPGTTCFRMDSFFGRGESCQASL